MNSGTKWYYAEYGSFAFLWMMKATQNNITVRRSAERGHADHGWLKSHHSFSFAEYYDPAHMGFRSLRVINQDIVAPGGGFPSHPHRDMEIFSYVISGTLEHKDSLGNGRSLQPGQVQLMSAGIGVTHSEFNPSTSESLHFLQIWIQPSFTGLRPSYSEWTPSEAAKAQKKVLMISADGREGSAKIHQDADVFRLKLNAQEVVDHVLKAGRGVWIQLISGELQVADTKLSAGDALSFEQAKTLEITALKDAEALLFDLA